MTVRELLASLTPEDLDAEIIISEYNNENDYQNHEYIYDLKKVLWDSQPLRYKIFLRVLAKFEKPNNG